MYEEYYAHKLAQRQKQIDIGKAHADYVYLQSRLPPRAIPKPPRPDDITLTKKRFDRAILEWKVAYHVLADVIREET
jgi:hypothetical protein